LEVSLAGTRRLLAVRTPLVVLIAFAILAFLLILAFGAPTVALGLDPSWTEVLAWGFLHRLQWGRDLVFTYGPLGFMQPYSSYVRGIFPWFATGQIVLPATFALTAVLLLRRCTLGQFLLFALAYICWCSDLAGDITWALTMLYGTTCLIDRRANTSRAAFYGLAVVLAPVFAVVALSKFSLFPLWALCVMAAAGNCLLERRMKRAGACLAIFVGALLAVWCACGQELANLPLFLLRSVQLAGGYGHAMGNRAPFHHEILALLLCGALLATCAVGAWRARSERGSVIVAGLVAASTALFWLACLTRGDHWPWFYPSIALLPFALIACTGLARDEIVRRAALAITVVATLVAFIVIPPGLIPRELVSRPQNAVRNLMHLDDLQRQRDADWAALARKSDMAKMRARIGNNRVDMVTWEQGLLLINGFNYAPRPVFQSYAAITPTLARLNASYFLGPAAPEFVMFKLDFIDARVPMSEDGLALIALLERYRPVLSERGFLLLQLDAAQQAPQPLLADDSAWTAARLGADIKFDKGTTPTAGFFRIDLSPFGRLYTLLFREPVLNLVVKTAKGEIRHRLVRATAASGFLVNPPVETNNDWVRRYFSMALPEVVSLRIEPESKWDRLVFNEDISLSFKPLELLHADPATVSRQIGGLLLYPGFDLMPTGGGDFRTIVEDGEESVFLHAPAKMTFQPTPGRYNLSAIYGVQGIAVRDPGCVKAGADGIGVSIVVHHGEEEIEVTHVDLDPFRSPRDAGPHKLVAQGFEVAPGDTVEYRVDAGPAGSNIGCDWTYVRNLVFVRQLQAARAPAAPARPTGSAKAAAPATPPAGSARLRAGFNIAPLGGELRFIVDEGKESMFLHAPSSVDFQPAPGRYQIEATFGLQNIAVDDPGCAKAKPDGIGVSLVLRHAGRQSVLRHVEVDPFAQAADRGPQRLAVSPVDIAAGDTLTYRVDPGHGGNNTACDWTYLRDFRALRMAPAPKPAAVPAPHR
jgi:hypothetical protein